MAATLSLEYTHALPRYFVDHLRNKRDDLLQESTLDYHSSCRELKIEYSESEYIPKFGRKALVETAVFNQLDTYDRPNHINVFESIGGEELAYIDSFKAFSNDAKDYNPSADYELTDQDPNPPPDSPVPPETGGRDYRYLPLWVP